MPARNKIIELIEKFDKFYNQLHSPDYNETELRVEYINPFFGELGWDVDNKQGYSQVYREVIHEAKMKRKDATGRPDYSFRIGGVPKFYVETKKPAVNIETDPNPALQLRSYIWTAKLPLGILTDFEEFAVYDGRIKPNKNDKASTARVLFIKYHDYPEKWDKIASIFSKEAILKGSFDEFAESTKAKKGTSDVDEEFLKEISRWREKLARNIALRNRKLSTRELNYIVQKTIDRIIFLRIAEDREIEDEFQLRNLIEGKNIYQRLQKIYWDADDKYNSGLFHFRNEQGRTDAPDNISLKVKIDDAVLKDIIKHLYYPDCPYAFAVMPADILGQVYEQFLGKVIRLTKGHQARIEYKPEVKKAGGVYYTPTYIVDYIVDNTVGKLLNQPKGTKTSARSKKSPTPEDIAKIKILDPACGSGSFLLGAYQKLLDWHLEWYSNHNPHKWARGKKPRIYQVAKDVWRLTTAEKKRILLNNIYGVDIDPQAVEVTKLSLLLKVLENENRETLGKMRSLFKERALPDLSNNIKCGNSLIGTDFYSEMNPSLFDMEEQYRINAFDWEKEFPEIMESGGFDVVIGNPPWGAELSKYEKNYVNNKFESKTKDTAALFLELCSKYSKNLWGMIVPKSIAFYSGRKSIRKFILKNNFLYKVLDTGISFQKVIYESIVLCASKEKICDRIEIDVAEPLKRPVHRKIIKKEGNLNPRICNIADIIVFKSAGKKKEKLLLKLSNNFTRLGDVKEEIFRGLYIPDKTKKQLKAGNIKWINKVPDVKRYYLKRFYMIDLSAYPKWENKIKKIMRPRLFLKVLRGNKLVAYPDIQGEFLTTEKLVNIIIDQNKYKINYLALTGIINSKLPSFFIQSVLFSGTTETSRVMDAIYSDYIPLPNLDFSNPSDVSKHDKMVSLVDRMLEIQKKIHESQIPDEKERYKRIADAIDEQIDELVYELYGLTEEEIKIVEGE